MLDILVEVLWFGLARFLSQDWLHALLFRLADSFELVIALFLPFERLQVEPLADCHACLSDELLPLTILHNLLAAWAGQLAIAKLEQLPLLGSTLFTQVLLL